VAADKMVDGTFELAAGRHAHPHRDRRLDELPRPHTPSSPATSTRTWPLPGLPPGQMRDGLQAMFADYTAHGFHGGNNLVLRTILGRAPRTLDSYLGELAA
jgi:hypothetical protein